MKLHMYSLAQFAPQTIQCVGCSTCGKWPKIVIWLAGHKHVQDMEAFADKVFDNTMRMFF